MGGRKIREQLVELVRHHEAVGREKAREKTGLRRCSFGCRYRVEDRAGGKSRDMNKTGTEKGERALQLKLLRRLCPSPSPNLLMPGVTAQMRSRTWQLQFWMARHGETDAVSVPLFLLSNCVIYHHIAFLLLSYTTISRNFAYLTLTYRLYRSNTSFSRSQEGGNAHSILHSILNHIIVY